MDFKTENSALNPSSLGPVLSLLLLLNKVRFTDSGNEEDKERTLISICTLL